MVERTCAWLHNVVLFLLDVEGHVCAGSVYALIHSIQSVAAFLGPLVHTTMFTATVRTMSSAVFIMSGTLLFIPLVSLG